MEVIAVDTLLTAIAAGHNPDTARARLRVEQ
jgi:hypothetical protein